MGSIRRDDLQKQLTKALDTALDSLNNIWEEIGIVQEQRGARIEVVMEHVRGLLTAMVEEEETLKDKLMLNVERYGEDLIRLCKELHRQPYEPPKTLSVLQLEKNLRTMVDRLNMEKHDRLKTMKRLREEDQHLCDILCATPYYIPSGTVPAEDQLNELETHVEGLKKEKDKRYHLFKSTKTNIVRLLDDLERSPNSSFEKEIVLEEDDSFLLSSENMKALKSYHDDLEENQKENFALAGRLREQLSSLYERLRLPSEEREAFTTKHTGFKPKVINALKEEIARCELLKLENMAMVIAGTRTELEEWWTKCYYSEQQRRRFTPFNNTHFTENLLEEHEREVERVREYYRQNEDMLVKVARRQHLWSEFLEFERKAADPNRFSNRGCNLLKEEKARKKLVKELPRVEQDVSEQIEVWEKQHGRAFLVGGQRFVDFIKTQWEEYKVNKELEKNQRLIKKTKEMEEEMIYGSKPVTPGKRRFIGTPAKTPNKLRKMNETGSKTPMSASRMHRSNFTSVYSPAIVPRHTGPKTPHRPRDFTTANSTTRKPLLEKTATTNETTFFSQTTVAGTAPHATPNDVSSNSSLASIGPYHDFAKGLNQNGRQNCRSSVMPQPGKPGAFF